MRRALIGLTLTAGLLVAGPAAPADAAPPTSGPASLDKSKWPSDLLWALPGTEQFNDRYMSPDDSDFCPASQGGDAFGYTMRYLRNVGRIFQSISYATSSPVLMIADAGPARTDLPDLREVWPNDVPAPLILLEGDTTICGDEWSQFGTQDASGAFGFGFYDAPDAGSVQWISDKIDASPSAKAAWSDRAGELPGAFDARDLTGYCSADNPFCLTASFLHCDAQGATARAVQACHVWNFNVVMYNWALQKVVASLALLDGDNASAPHRTVDFLMDRMGTRLSRTGVDPAGEPLAAADSTAGVAAQIKTLNDGGYLSTWFIAMNLKPMVDSLRTLTVVVTVGTALLVGAAAAAAAWWLGLGLLAALGVGVGAAALTAFAGTISCATDPGKCLTKLVAEGLTYTLGLIPSAAAATRYPNMTSAVWRSTLSDIASVSAAVLLVLCLLNMLFALVTGRIQMVFRGLLGVVGWAILLTVGGSVLTLLVQARNAAIGRLGGAGDVLTGMASSVVASIDTVASGAGFVGWFLLIVLCLLALPLALIVYVVLLVSAQWLPLIVGIMILQAAGLAAPGLAAGKWFGRGLSMLWTLLITPVIIVLIWRIGSSMLVDARSGIATLIMSAFVLLLCAAAPLLVAGMFSLGASGRLGAGAALLGAGLAAFAVGKGIQGLRGGAASLPGQSAAALQNNQLSGGGSAASRGGPTRIATESGQGQSATGTPSTGTSGTTPTDTSSTADPWAAPRSTDGRAQTPAGGEGQTSRGAGPAGSRPGMNGSDSNGSPPPPRGKPARSTQGSPPSPPAQERAGEATPGGSVGGAGQPAANPPAAAARSATTSRPGPATPGPGPVPSPSNGETPSGRGGSAPPAPVAAAGGGLLGSTPADTAAVPPARRPSKPPAGDANPGRSRRTGRPARRIVPLPPLREEGDPQ